MTIQEIMKPLNIFLNKQMAELKATIKMLQTDIVAKDDTIFKLVASNKMTLFLNKALKINKLLMSWTILNNICVMIIW